MRLLRLLGSGHRFETGAAFAGLIASYRDQQVIPTVDPVQARAAGGPVVGPHGVIQFES